MNFSFLIVNWYLENKRALPWRNTSDPYHIWLSEVILQQTRVNQGLSYYLKFVKTYPTIQDLAQASEDEILKLWQGLGYYSRARNMHAAAKHVVFELNSKFPESYDELIKLKGIGNYSAAAISSFAFNEARAVVDGNVYRLLSRIFGISIPINSAAGQKEFTSIANELMDNRKPAEFNQAMMEFGALQCIPKNPDCQNCVFILNCVARRENRINNYPVKSGKIQVRKRFFNYLVLESPDFIYFNKRVEKDIWKGLYDFPLIERENSNNLKNYEVLAEARRVTSHENIVLSEPSKAYKHLLSHQQLHVKFWKVKLQENVLNNSLYLPVKKDQADKIAVPVLIQNYMKESSMLA